MTVYFSLGTNLGDKEQNLRMAVLKIGKQIGEVISLSAFYATAPWGFSSDNTFLNAALCVETALAPLEVLRTTQEIEHEMGRTHKSVNAVYSDRVIDIDLLLCLPTTHSHCAGYARIETSPSADARTRFCDASAGGDSAPERIGDSSRQRVVKIRIHMFVGNRHIPYICI